MTREGVGMGEGFGAERIAGSAEREAPESDAMHHAPGATRPYLLLLLLVDLEDQVKERVKPAVQAELARVELAESEIQSFMAEAASWAQTGLQSRKAMEGGHGSGT